MDEDGIIKDVSAYAAKCFGHAKSDMYEKSLASYLISLEGKFSTSDFDQLFNANNEMMALKKDSTLFSFTSTLKTIELEQGTDYYLTLNIIDDIFIDDPSADKFIKNLLDVNLFGASIANLDGSLLYGNKSLLNMLQCSKEDFVGKDATDFYNKQSDREKIVAEVKKYGFIKDVDVELRRNNGSTFLVSLSFLKSTFAGINCYFCWFYDLTPRLEIQQELEEQRNLSFHHAKLASIGKLAAGVGHEINNPLSILKLSINILKKELHKEESKLEKIDKYINNMDITIDRISKIVLALTSFSRSDTAESFDFDIIEALSESVGLVEDIYKIEQIEFQYQPILSEKILVNGNRGKFQQVIMNLFSNAKDAQIDLKRKAIDVSVHKKDSMVLVKIKDYGVGIKDEIIGQIFDPFFTTKDVNKGTGIGLAIAHTIVKEFGGLLEANSNPGKSTTFTITIPIVKNY